MAEPPAGNRSHRPTLTASGPKERSEPLQDEFHKLQENLADLRTNAVKREQLAAWATGSTSDAPEIVKQLAWLAKQKRNDPAVMRFLGTELIASLAPAEKRKIRTRIVEHMSGIKPSRPVLSSLLDGLMDKPHVPAVRWDSTKTLAENTKALALLLPEGSRKTFILRNTPSPDADPGKSADKVTVHDFGATFAKNKDEGKSDEAWRVAAFSTAFTAFRTSQELISEFVQGLFDTWVQEPSEQTYKIIPMLLDSTPGMSNVLDRLEREGLQTRSTIATKLLPAIMQGPRDGKRETRLTAALNWLGASRMSEPVLQACIRAAAESTDPAAAGALVKALGSSLAAAPERLRDALAQLQTAPTLLKALLRSFDEGVSASRRPGSLIDDSVDETALGLAVAAFNKARAHKETPAQLERRLAVMAELPGRGELEANHWRAVCQTAAASTPAGIVPSLHPDARQDQKHSLRPSDLPSDDLTADDFRVD